MSLRQEKHTSFLGARIPPEIESMSNGLKDVEQEIFRKLLKAVVNALEEKDCRDTMMSIADKSGLPQEKLSHIVAGMYRLLSEAIRIPQSLLKQEAFKEDLRELSRTALETANSQRDPHLPTIDEFKWRVDVAISTSSLARALQPSVLMQMKLSDGNFHQFEVPPAKFQELRYNVALILKEMNDLEKRSILKIQD
ncbi:COMM domain-containing protein 5 isoform X1 [Syngnathoides biaculeatus]|uniref:COMM domain-containing protein 5 isoform X1 n=1 Tax=Syngnathoides biaculeatus TaxID=300417 RepID=UPI002ADDCD33|nr:COMM domain-containing protein 5 isoform X1 [Syngnathoides biaculeatus]